MAPAEISYVNTSSSEYPNKPGSQENDFKSNLMKMLEVCKEEMGRSFYDIQENACKQGKPLKRK